MIELEDALNAIKTLSDYCRQTNISVCENNMCGISRWCLSLKSNTTPDGWKGKEQE